MMETSTDSPAGEELEELSEEETQCFLHGMAWFAENPLEGSYCNVSWTHGFCWPPTEAGKSASGSCFLMRPVDGNITTLLELPVYAWRKCLEDGTWAESVGDNATRDCVVAQRTTVDDLKHEEVLRQAMLYIIFFGSILSLVCLFASLGIYQYFKNIHCARITIHKHFMAALAFKCIIFILMTASFVFGFSNDFIRETFLCKTMIFAQHYAFLAVINWMFVQGHYLNSKMTTNVFGRKFPIKCYIFLGWGFSLLTVFAWCIAMELYYPMKHNCWAGYGNSHLIWIIVAPMLAVLLTNLLFLGKILRILLTKNCREREGQLFRAVKATLVLFPLLGLNVLVFFVNPGGQYQIYYMLTNAVLHSSQGMFVSILYCFTCHDVQDAIRRKWGRLTMMSTMTRWSTKDRNPSPLAMTQL